MFNFKTEMIENTKIEKWSSLRLDLQQFSPQEFVAACYYINCIGNTLYGNYLSVNYSENKPGNVTQVTHSHSGRITSKSTPTLATRYVWESYKAQNGHVSNYVRTVYIYDGHISASPNWTESLNNPNVSG